MKHAQMEKITKDCLLCVNEKIGSKFQTKIGPQLTQILMEKKLIVIWHVQFCLESKLAVNLKSDEMKRNMQLREIWLKSMLMLMMTMMI
jgi:hypothetical protein